MKKLIQLLKWGVAEEGSQILIPPFSYTLDTAQNTPMKYVTTEVSQGLETLELIDRLSKLFYLLKIVINSY